MSPFYDQDGIVIYCGDCREILPSLGLVDHTITDPPYDERTHAGARTAAKSGTPGIGGQRAITGVSRLDIEFAPLVDFTIVSTLLASSQRWVVCFCTMEMIASYRLAAGEAWVRAGFWRRADGAPQFTGDRPATPGDAIAIMHRAGRKAWNGGGKHAYWERGVERVDRVHPTQKPEALMADIVADFTDAGDLVLDPYMGSGTTLLACKRLARRAIGIELNERYAEIAATRLSQSVLPLEYEKPRIQRSLLEAIPPDAQAVQTKKVRPVRS